MGQHESYLTVSLPCAHVVSFFSLVLRIARLQRVGKPNSGLNQGSHDMRTERHDARSRPQGRGLPLDTGGAGMTPARSARCRRARALRSLSSPVLAGRSLQGHGSHLHCVVRYHVPPVPATGRTCPEQAVPAPLSRRQHRCQNPRTACRMLWLQRESSHFRRMDQELLGLFA